MSNRERRDYWTEFLKRVIDKYPLIWPSVELYGEAIRCFDAGAYLACCILCRSAMEALLHIAKTRSDSTITFDPHTGMTELLDWAETQGLLGKDRPIANNIRDKGDFGAHLAQKLDKEYKNCYDRFKVQLNNNLTERELLVPYDLKQVPTWIGRKECEKVIKDTYRIILDVTRNRWGWGMRGRFSPTPKDI